MRFATVLFALLSPLFVHASEGAMPMRHANVDVTDTAALQRGAKLYMNYCSGCHSLKYVRYSQMAKGLGLLTFDGRPGERDFSLTICPAASFCSGVVVAPVSKFLTRSEIFFFE